MGSITIQTVAVPVTARKNEVTQAPGGKNGNLPVSPNASIAWRAGVPGEVFQLFFYDLESPGTAFWPFIEVGPQGHPPDGYAGPGTHENPYLLVGNPAKPRKLKGDAPDAIKYDVVAMNPIGVDRLDPVIIIRPNSLARDSVLLGVTSAVLGAVAGAAVTALFL